ncbi:TusE/DsrC/DsvC family sulfur relay protein [Candidatus Tachikawaea gelatinosa]|uniref:Sulfurtransferase n=1 Tax=Candidatus Tachikawaea gelatinosa TaxID=1410383 RepID=A0A090BWG8_9ENTR|nr:TusE/DsrC/DsvC family sulfur relay protein [Candidatus Tachikawaea gelatinosa]BAP58581.1 sulfurtransferase [Candidatus Tachikawaea gelatinosa]
MNIKNKEKKFDKEGYLKSYINWDEEIAKEIAKKESIILTEIHWEIIKFIRNFYLKFHIYPKMRFLVQEIKKKYGPKKGNSRYFLYLFPKNPKKQSAKIAGLPKPNKCIE